MALSAGNNLGPYRIIEPIGRGGMASVFRAYEASLDRYVALKVLPPEFLHDPTFAERFRREARTVARLEHPQIIPIFAYDIDAETGTPWMAMRLIAGGSLAERIKRGRLTPIESARILKDVADALDYAHGAGVIHRDVKPQNVLLDDAGRVYLADFGIAKMVEGAPQITQTGMITGTPQYMAPEQALGRSIDKAVDIYALGIVAYELFAGRVPFSADTPVAVLIKQANEPMPLPPVSLVKEEVTRAILRATAKDPLARWPTATAFAQALSTAVTSAEPVRTTSLISPIPETIPGGLGPARPTIRARTSGTSIAQPDRPAGVKRARGVWLAAGALMMAGAMYVGYRNGESTKTMGAPSSAALSPTPMPAQTTGPASPTPPVENNPVDPGPTRTSTTAARAVITGLPPAGQESPSPRARSLRAAHARIKLVVETFLSGRPQINLLFARVLIDGQPVREFLIRFAANNTLARRRRVENIILDKVPWSARELTLLVTSDPRSDQERTEGSTKLSLSGETTSIQVTIRLDKLDQSVTFQAHQLN